MMKEIGNLKVNDGNGLHDNEGMCDSLVNDCNNLIKYIFNGQYIVFCNTVVQMSLKLANLQKGIRTDMESKDKIIDELKRINDDLQSQITGLPVDRSGDDGTD